MSTCEEQASRLANSISSRNLLKLIVYITWQMSCYIIAHGFCFLIFGNLISCIMLSNCLSFSSSFQIQLKSRSLINVLFTPTVKGQKADCLSSDTPWPSTVSSKPFDTFWFVLHNPLIRVTFCTLKENRLGCYLLFLNAGEKTGEESKGAVS